MRRLTACASFLLYLLACFSYAFSFALVDVEYVNCFLVCNHIVFEVLIVTALLENHSGMKNRTCTSLDDGYVFGAD
jgi:hypothetical protein